MFLPEAAVRHTFRKRMYELAPAIVLFCVCLSAGLLLACLASLASN